MSWTEERIEELRKLWGEGLSASQIANTLGGVSRNAVIGKIHRLGLSGRVKTPRSPARRAPAAVRPAKPKTQPRVMAVGSTVVKVVDFGAFVNFFGPRGAGARTRGRAAGCGGGAPPWRCQPFGTQPLHMPLADRRPGGGKLPLLRRKDEPDRNLLQFLRRHCLPRPGPRAGGEASGGGTPRRTGLTARRASLAKWHAL